MEGKKISFGFLKTKKVDKPVVEEKKDFIECVEEKAIKVIGGEEIKETAPLVIPMKPNTLVTAERLKEIAEKVEGSLEETENVEKGAIPQVEVPENETLDQMAVRELLQDAKRKVELDSPTLTVPLPAKPVNEGEKESTLEDYESVPVQDFGLAMLRGMGWAPGKEKASYKQPQLRPKGLGLGADKVVKTNQKQKVAKDSKGEDLAIVKNAFVKITTGKYSGYYGKVVSLDEDNGRVMVDLAVKKETVSLSEFMMESVTKSEYDKESKVINQGSFEEYKKMEASKKSSSQDGENSSGRSKEKSNRDNKYSETDGKYSERDSRYSERDSKNSEKSSEYSQKDSRTYSDRDNKYSGREATSSRSEDKRERDERSRTTDNKSNKNGRDYKEEERRERDRDRAQRSSRKEMNKKYSSNESLGSLSDEERYKSKKKEIRKRSDSSSESDRGRKKKSKKKDKDGYDSSDSESDYRSKRHKTPEGKRDIDKKRKGKKKKRDRDRSPNYRKHRK